jgi:chemotaxis regulatin CheY-phosphate phosphatase CheZ
MYRGLFEDSATISLDEKRRRRSESVRTKVGEITRALEYALGAADEYESASYAHSMMDLPDGDERERYMAAQARTAMRRYCTALHRLAVACRAGLETATGRLVPSVDMAGSGLNQAELTTLCEMLGWPARGGVGE